MTWTLYEGDCFDYLPKLEDGSIDMVLCDLPYGTTACKWDTPLPLKELWEQYERVIKPNGAIVLFGSEPFSSILRTSNLKLYRYDWIWHKSKAGNFMSVKNQPQKLHENVSVFYKKQPAYTPIMEKSTNKSSFNKGGVCNANILGVKFNKPKYYDTGLRFPSSIQFFSNQRGELNNTKRLHPTQKPVALFEYLIKTYANPGDTVLDNCAGSGTTGVACENTGRNSILMEKEPEYCQIIRNRLMEVTSQKKLDVGVGV